MTVVADGPAVASPPRNSNGAAPDRRHPVEVTVSRLTDHVEAYGRNLTPDEVDDLARAVEVLDTLRARLDAAARRRAQRGEA